jgi:hypothetical protein
LAAALVLAGAGRVRAGGRGEQFEPDPVLVDAERGHGGEAERIIGSGPQI